MQYISWSGTPIGIVDIVVQQGDIAWLKSQFAPLVIANYDNFFDGPMRAFADITHARVKVANLGVSSTWVSTDVQNFYIALTVLATIIDRYIECYGNLQCGRWGRRESWR